MKVNTHVHTITHHHTCTHTHRHYPSIKLLKRTTKLDNNLLSHNKTELLNITNESLVMTSDVNDAKPRPLLINAEPRLSFLEE